MVSKESYPRWLDNTDAWTADDDWEPDEYLEWVKRLSDAKKDLKNTYLEVDTQAINLVKTLCESLKSDMPPVTYGKHNFDSTAKIIVRFGAAYNFYNRITFEDLPDSKAVARVKKYLPRIKIGMHTNDIARMLQAAADKVSFSKAVFDIISDYTSYVEKALPLLDEWYQKVSKDSYTNAVYCWGMQVYSKTGIPKVDELPAIFLKLQNPDEGGYTWLDKKQSENALEVLNTDERIEQFLALRLDPGVNSSTGYVRTEIGYLKVLLASKKLKDVLDQIASLEKDNLSWSKTVGPACVAIIRLGKRSQGKDLEKLAEYARKHSQRPK